MQPQAAQALDPIFAPEQSRIQAQVPAIQQLYSQLLQGIQQQSNVGAQTVAQSAQQRGVMRAALPGELQSTLGQQVGLQQATLGAQQAQNVSDITGNLTQLGRTRASSINELAQALQTRQLREQEAQFEAQRREQETQMRLQELDREAALAAQQERLSRSGGGGRASGGVSAEYKRAISGALAQVRGKDGKVSPRDYNQALQQWVAGGGEPNAFHESFKGYVNLKHSQDYYQPQGTQAREQLQALIGAGQQTAVRALSNQLRRFF